MKGKKAYFDKDARERLLKGAELLYRAVSATMGPNSGNAVLGNLPYAPRITHDGVTVAKSLEIKPTEDNLGEADGLELLKETSIRMDEIAGDGTTTVTVLAYHLLKSACEMIDKGANPMELRRSLELSAARAIEQLAEMRTPLENNEAIEAVATISAGDPEIGRVIADIVDKVGRDAEITIEEGNGMIIESEIVNGYTFESGYSSQYFVTDQSRQEAVLNNPYVLLINRRVGFERDIFPILEKVAKSGHRELLIIADAVESEALAALVLNKQKGVINSVVVHAPGNGDGRKKFLEDMAALTGGKIIDTDNGEEVTEVLVDELGRAEKIIVTARKTTILGGRGDVHKRVDDLKEQLKTCQIKDMPHLEQRIAGLQGKVAVITVGGGSQIEIEERKYRVEDAVKATKAAVKEGIVPGGETALLWLSRQIVRSTPGDVLLCHAMEQPFKVLMENAGYKQELESQIQVIGQGIDAKTGKLVDLIKQGIIDPAFVTREAIQNAVSVAGVGMTMNVLIVEEPDESSQK